MSEETAFDQMAADVFNGLGIDATYIPKIGDSVALKVHYDQAVEYNPGGYPGQGQDYLKTIEFVSDDIGAIPGDGDVFIIGQTRYAVEKILDHDGRGRFIKVVVN
jgi:hypothetical protein